MTSKKDTGFHPHDPDWTRGRARALADADAAARASMWNTRKVILLSDKEAGHE